MEQRKQIKKNREMDLINSFYEKKVEKNAEKNVEKKGTDEKQD